MLSDTQAALAQVREALAAGPTRGNWVVAPKMTMPSIVCAVNNVEVCPADHRDPSHQDVDAAYIAKCNPANIAAILAHVEAQAAEIERLTAERDEARAERDAMTNVLPGYYYMDPPDGGDVPVLEQLRRMAKDAARYRWLRGSSCPDHSRRWTLWEIRHWRAPFWTGDLRHGDLDAAIDAAMGLTRPAEEA